MIAFAPPPPDYTHFRNRTSLQVRVSKYGFWSSSGETSHFFSAAYSPSGRGIFQEKRVAQLRQALERLTDVVGLAHAQNVQFSLHTLLASFNLLNQFHTEIASLSPHSPHITWSSDAEIVLEWRQAEKRLVLYLQEHHIEYLKSWGSDIYSEMEDGEVFSLPEVTKLWGWLKG